MLSLIDLKNILLSIQYKNWDILINGSGLNNCYIQVRFISNGQIQSGRKWQLSKHMTKSEVVQTIFKAILTAEEHEVREIFLYRGKAIFGPHIDVNTLVEVCENIDARKQA